MHIWTIENWRKHYNANHRKGLRFVIDKNVDIEVKNACKEFGVWLRKEYYFPIRVPVYVKSHEKIKAQDGDLVVGTFFWPDSMDAEPYVRVAAGDYVELKNKRGRYNALVQILLTIAHELTHYYQWVNNLKLTERGEERQATAYSRFILQEYLENNEQL